MKKLSNTRLHYKFRQTGTTLLNQQDNSARGFTIVELLIASTVFSVVLLLAAAAVIKVGQIYYKGIISSRTQEISRSIVDEISRAVQFNGGQVSPPLTPTPGTVPSSGTAYGFCIDNKRYSYVVDRELVDVVTDAATQSKQVFVVDDGCATGVALQLDGTVSLAPTNGRELLGDHMRLGTIPYPVLQSGNLYRLNVAVIYADEPALKSKIAIAPATVPATYTYVCAANNSGGQFCSVSQLSTIIEKRVQ